MNGEQLDNALLLLLILMLLFEFEFDIFVGEVCDCPTG